MLGTVASLVFGVLIMAKGGSAQESGWRQNKLMAYRIWFQAAAIVLMLLVFSAAKH